MMHSEMEMVESIRQSEDNMAIMNTRIERLKVGLLGFCVEIHCRLSRTNRLPGLIF